MYYFCVLFLWTFLHFVIYFVDIALIVFVINFHYGCYNLLNTLLLYIITITVIMEPI